MPGTRGAKAKQSTASVEEGSSEFQRLRQHALESRTHNHQGIGRAAPRSSPHSSPRSRSSSTERNINPRLLAAAEQPMVTSAGYDPTLPHHAAVGSAKPAAPVCDGDEDDVLHTCARSSGGEVRARRWLRLAESRCSGNTKARLLDQYRQFWGDLRTSQGKMLSENDAVQIAKDLGRTYASEDFCTPTFLQHLERVLSTQHPKLACCRLFTRGWQV